jgi:FixJ family two-component response regulator
MTAMKEIGATKDKATVHVVDDDDALRTSLVFLLETAGMGASGYGQAEDFLAVAEQIARPACVLLDLRMPGGGGLMLQEEIVRRGLDIPIIVMTAYAEVSLVVRTFRHGAIDFIEKPFSEALLLDRVRAAVDLDRRRYQALIERRQLDERFRRLTAREREVLDLAALGMANKCIAYDLGISMKTVECHRSKIMQKLGVGSFGELVRLQCAYLVATSAMPSSPTATLHLA